MHQARFRFMLSDEWSQPWPLHNNPPPDFVLSMNAEFVLDLTPLQTKAMEDGPNSLAHEWFSAIAVPEDGCLGLFSLIYHTVRHRPLRSLFAQLIYQCARRVEFSMTSAMTRGRADETAIGVAADDLLAVLHNRHALDYNLCKHIVACRSMFESGNHYFFGTASDKANVGGLHLANTFITTISNKTAVCAPQAGPALIP